MLSSSGATAAGHAMKRTRTVLLRRPLLLPPHLRPTYCLGETMGDPDAPSIDHHDRGGRGRGRSPLLLRQDGPQTPQAALFRSFSRAASTRRVARDGDYGGTNLRWHPRPASLVGISGAARLRHSADVFGGIISSCTPPRPRRSPFSTAANVSAAARGTDSSSSTTNDGGSKRGDDDGAGAEGGDQRKKEEQQKKDDDDGGSNIFFDNMGKIFLGSIALVIASLIRSSKSQNNKEKMRELLETSAVLDPLEIDDLRCANVPDLNGEAFRGIMAVTIDAFPGGGATYGDFVSVALQEMRRMRGEGFTVQLGHLLDRAAIAVLEERQRQGRGAGGAGGADEVSSEAPDTFATGSGGGGGVGGLDNGGDEADGDGLLPLPLLHALLSMALSGTVDERVALLFSSMRGTAETGAPPSTSREDEVGGGIGGGGTAPASSTDGGTVSEGDVVAMVGYLQSTGQLPPATQILEEAGAKYPTQRYKRGSPRELVDKAKEQLGMIDKEGRDVAGERRRYRLEDFDNVLRSGSVCAWGECYSPRKAKKP